MNLIRWNSSQHYLLGVLCLLCMGCGGEAAFSATDTSMGSHSSALSSSSVLTGSMASPRTGHQALLLTSGKVLVLGGSYKDPATNQTVSLTTMELYDRATGTWSNAGTVHPNIKGSTATVLPSGKVLFAGRHDDDGAYSGYGTNFNQALLYDPANGTWTATGNMLQPRSNHSAFLLSSGKVFVLAGRTNDGISNAYLATAELYDPATGTWSSAGTMPQLVADPKAVELASGKVLIAGGYYPYYPNSGDVATAQIYNPTTNSWSLTNPMTTARYGHSIVRLASGKVLVASGSCGILCGTSRLSAELYDPDTGTWSATGGITTYASEALISLLPSGHVALVGESQVQMYDPALGTWQVTGTLSTSRTSSSRVLLPSNEILVAGGYAWNQSTGNITNYYSSAELVTFPTWKVSASMGTARGSHTITLLNTGKVLAAGGSDGTATTATTELYTPSTDTWVSTGSMVAPRESHSATLLASGRVLVVGGISTTTGTAYDTAEEYDPTTGQWTARTAHMLSPRQQHTAVRLGSGKVLVMGGFDGANFLATAEVYDPATGTWASAGSMSTPRYHHASVLLPSGKVLVTGGYGGGVATLASAEVYDPATNAWSAVSPMTGAREGQTAVVLASGKVLVIGGAADYFWLSTAELYDPATNTWTSAGSMSSPREGHSATLLNSGDILVAGGFDGTDYVYTAEIYKPSTGTWESTVNMASLRYGHQALTLPSGMVLAVGGYGFAGPLKTVETYRP
ncbi:Kelch repeat-containing protein [Hyalangium versicolor]|uniref:Kelch repeat-containing protein n=1 Tax=Hyalangium versicolor TaxID=2861190 RepID=UPI001CC9852B|nr:kelch repeat-containing protein [Hyalangium versicolor]